MFARGVHEKRGTRRQGLSAWADRSAATPAAASLFPRVAVLTRAIQCRPLWTCHGSHVAFFS